MLLQEFSTDPLLSIAQDQLKKTVGFFQYKNLVNEQSCQ